MRLDEFNALTNDTAEQELLSCCASGTWARAIATGRPYPDTTELHRQAARTCRDLDDADLSEALREHPRIGERATGTSAREQQGVNTAEQATLDALAEGNWAYERRFDRVFLICASGLSAEQMLQALHERLRNDPETERTVVIEELTAITLLRLERLVS